MNEQKMKDPATVAFEKKLKTMPFTCYAVVFDKKREGYRLVEIAIEGGKVKEFHCNDVAGFDTQLARFASAGYDFWKHVRVEVDSDAGTTPSRA